MNKVALKKEFLRIMLKYSLLLLFVSCIRFLVLQTEFLHLSYRASESLSSKLVRSFDLIAILLVFIPYFRRGFYQNKLVLFASNNGLTLSELIERYDINRKYFEITKGDLKIRLTKQNKLLRDLERASILK